MLVNLPFLLLAGVLEEEDDTLINVNIVDNEKAKENLENKKKKPDYKPYDEPEYDEYGVVSANSRVECSIYI